MKKKLSLAEGALAIAASAKTAKSVGKGQVSADEDVYTGSAINLRRGDWKLLRRVAESRSDKRAADSGKGGGRPSVSKVIESLIDAHRDSLFAESNK